MKSLEELRSIRDKAKAQVSLRKESEDQIRVFIGMGNCGIEAGAKSVLQALMEEIEKRNFINVAIIQTDCIGICEYEPIMQVILPGKDKVTYVNMTPEKVIKVVNDHIVNQNVVEEFTIGANS